MREFLYCVIHEFHVEPYEEGGVVVGVKCPSCVEPIVVSGVSVRIEWERDRLESWSFYEGLPLHVKRLFLTTWEPPRKESLLPFPIRLHPEGRYDYLHV